MLYLCGLPAHALTPLKAVFDQMLRCLAPGLQSINRFDFHHVGKEQGYTRLRSRLRSLVYPWQRANYKSTRLLLIILFYIRAERE